MASPLRKSPLALFPALLFVCALLVVPAEAFHFHADGHAHADCPTCLGAFVPAILNPAPLPVAIFYGCILFPVSPPAGPVKRLFSGNSQLSCGPPCD